MIVKEHLRHCMFPRSRINCSGAARAFLLNFCDIALVSSVPKPNRRMHVPAGDNAAQVIRESVRLRESDKKMRGFARIEPLFTRQGARYNCTALCVGGDHGALVNRHRGRPDRCRCLILSRAKLCWPDADKRGHLRGSRCLWSGGGGPFEHARLGGTRGQP